MIRVLFFLVLAVFVGSSVPRPFGGSNYYDRSGRKVGYSEPRTFGGYNYYDKSGRSMGYSEPKPFGGYGYYQINRPNRPK